jgi:hypothetical protein
MGDGFGKKKVNEMRGDRKSAAGHFRSTEPLQRRKELGE